LVCESPTFSNRTNLASSSGGSYEAAEVQGEGEDTVGGSALNGLLTVLIADDGYIVESALSAGELDDLIGSREVISWIEFDYQGPCKDDAARDVQRD